MGEPPGSQTWTIDRTQKRSSHLPMLVFLLLSTLLSSCQNSTASKDQSSQQSSQGVWVSANGSQSVGPNIAHVSFSIVSSDMRAKRAQEMNAKIKERVGEALRENFEISSKDFKTSSYEMNPRYDYIKGERQFRGFEISHRLNLTFRKLDKLGDLLDMIVEKGASKIQRIQFDREHPEKIRNQAILKALERAKEKGQKIAQGVGKKLGQVISVREGNFSFEEPVRGGIKALSTAESGRGRGTSLEAGELEIAARVRVHFSLVD